jgi:predicted ArsR family transcriptional regulator
MERQTRHLLRVLADDLTDALLREITKSGRALETDLQRRVPGSRQTIARRLAELESLGVAIGEDQPTPGRGRPTRSWFLASPEVAKFRREADEFLLRLLEGQALRHGEAIRPSRPGSSVRQLRP